MQSKIATLRETLRDEDKVLKVLIDNAQRVYAEYRSKLDDGTYCRLDPNASMQAIMEAADLIWDPMRDAFSNGPDFVFEEPKKRRTLRQSLRLMNFTNRAVDELLKDSERQFQHHLFQNYWRGRLRTAECALSLAEKMTSLVSPGPKTYDHPQFRKWHELSARCKRRIAAIWSSSAQEDVERAKLELAARYRD